MPVDLHHARVAMERARRSPTAAQAKLELYEAEFALAKAERDQQAGDSMAKVEAYVAQRMADRARLAGLFAADQEAELRARVEASRIQRNIARRIDAAQDRAQRTEQEARKQEAERPVMLRALDQARGGRGELRWNTTRIQLRLPTEILFQSWMPVLKRGADEQLQAIASAIRAGPPCEISIRVLDDVEGRTMDRRLLSRRRAARLREVLLAHGVPAEAFFAHPDQAHGEPNLPLGTQVDLIFTAQPVLVPPVPLLVSP
jgi:outer membrane protein OmpA-like peptidoglycan-associated protein